MDSAVTATSSQECQPSSQEPPAKKLKQSSLLSFVSREKKKISEGSPRIEEPQKKAVDEPKVAEASQNQEPDGDLPLWPSSGEVDDSTPPLFSGAVELGAQDDSTPDILEDRLTQPTQCDTQATVFTASEQRALEEAKAKAVEDEKRIEASRKRLLEYHEKLVALADESLFDSPGEETEIGMDPEMRERAAAAALQRATVGGGRTYQLSPSSSEASNCGMPSTPPSPADVTPQESPVEPTQELDSPSWKGCPLEDLLKAPLGSFRAAPLRRNGDEKHVILFKLPSPTDGTIVPSPWPEKYREVWGSDHVHMPCSKYNVSPEFSKSRWQEIEENLLDPIRCVEDFLEAVQVYNPRAGSDPSGFSGLKDYVVDVMTKQERVRFFDKTLPAIINLALKLPEVVTHPPPLLKKGVEKSLSLSQYQIACLLANAFLCTFPRRNFNRYRQREHQYVQYPDINFDRLFAPARVESRKNGKLEKLKSIIHYFERVTEEAPTGVVTITRRHRHERDLPAWHTSDIKIASKVHICAEGVIEVQGKGLLELDFANKFIGGGVMESGLVQEEIRFVLWPELIITRLVTECLSDREVLVITGAQQFSMGAGYSDSFEWTGDFDGEHPPRDEYGRKMTQILAIDAVSFDNPADQVLPKFLLRELNKAFIGFLTDAPQPSEVVGVATGNWGCGAFRGDPRLKFLLQLMAVSQAGRDGMAYFTFKDARLRDDLHRMHEFLVEKRITVGRLFRALREFARKDMKIPTLYNFLFHHLSEEEVKPKPIHRPSKPPSKELKADRDRPSAGIGPEPRKAPIATAESVPVDIEEEEDELVMSSQCFELQEVKVHSTEKKDDPEAASKRPDGSLWDLLDKEEEKNPVVMPSK